MADATPRRYSLDVIPIASPCTEDWSRMHGSEAVKFCDKCQLHVHNLSAMPEAEANALLARREGRLCVRYDVAPPTPEPVQTPVSEPMPIELRRKRGRPAAWWRRAAAMVGLGFLGGASLSLSGCGEQEQVMGDAVPTVTLDPHQVRPQLQGTDVAMGGAIAPPVVEMIAVPTTQPAPTPSPSVRGEVAWTRMGDVADLPPKIMGKPAPPATQPANQPQPATCEPGQPLTLTRPAPVSPVQMMGSPPPNIVMGEIEAPRPPAPKRARPATQPNSGEPQSRMPNQPSAAAQAMSLPPLPSAPRPVDKQGAPALHLLESKPVAQELFAPWAKQPEPDHAIRCFFFNPNERRDPGFGPF